MLKIKNLNKSFGGLKAVNDVNLEIDKGSITGLIGPNGAGKTTSFYTIVGLIKPNSGSIVLDDTDITSYPMYQRAQNGIGYLAQEASVFRKLSVEDNIRCVLELTAMNKSEQQEKTESLLEEFSLTAIRKNRGDLLSGGERRRTEIARALATDPKFLLLDEPFAGVDPIAINDLQNLIRKLKNKNIGILITDHNVRATLAITERSYILNQGEILANGSSEQLTRSKVVRESYLGNSFD